MRLAARLSVLLAAVAVIAVGLAAPASAHVTGGPVVSDFSSVVTSVEPSMPGVAVRTVDAGDRVELTNDSEVVVGVPGYSGEPYLLIGDGRVQRNELSPATYLNETKAGDSAIPAGATPGAAPRWVTVAAGNTYQWHDHRVHWMGTALPPSVQADPGVAHTVADWSIPLTYGGTAVTVAGTLRWTPAPATWPWWVLLIALVAAGALARGPWAIGLLGMAVTAEVGHLVASPGVTPGAVLPAVTAGLLAVLAGRSLRRGSGVAPYALGAAGWILVAAGVSDLDVLWHSQLPTTGPAWATRAAIVVSLGSSLGVAVAAWRVARRAPVVSGSAGIARTGPASGVVGAPVAGPVQ